MKSKFDRKISQVEFVRRYVEKHADPSSTMDIVVSELCDLTQHLLEENFSLKEKLFEIEQSVEPENRWENILAAKLARAVEANDREDFLEITNSINNDIWIITIQKKFGNTPKQALQQSEIRRDKALNKASNLLDENKQMQKKLHQQELELRTFKSLKLRFNDPETTLKTRQDIEAAIKALNLHIGQYNAHVYREGISRLSSSMTESYHEAWARASDTAVKLQVALKEKQALLAKITTKKITLNKFGKYRRKIAIANGK